MNFVRWNLYPWKLKDLQIFNSFLLLKRCVSYFGKWELPSGYDPQISIYNSAVNRKVPLILKNKDLATWYVCGPTVYAESHIGHACCYVKFDIMRRILEKVFNINVIVLLGVTDVDDKIIKKSNEIGITALELALKFEREFFEDMETLRVLPATVVSRVSQNIPLIISFCEKLIEKQFAYATKEGNVYFKIARAVTGNLLSEMPKEMLDIQEKYKDNLKEDPRDFALWKTSKPNEPFWESPWGRGRPGWHIECSAMASKMFGAQMDLHSGGYDLLFPHHTNEKSQSEAYHSCSQWVNYWIHSGLLQIEDGTKMSKSLNNTLSIKDFLEEHCVNDFRILCLQSMYRKNLYYNSMTLSGAKSLHKKLHNFINDCEMYISGEVRGCLKSADKLLEKLASTKEQVEVLFRNDFNTTQALLCLTDLVDEVNKSLPSTDSSLSVVPEDIPIVFSCCCYVNQILEIVGIDILSKKKLPRNLVFAVDAAVEFRNNIRLFALNLKEKKFREYGTSEKYFEDIYRKLNGTIEMTCQSKDNTECVPEIVAACKNCYEKLLIFAKTIDEKTIDSLELSDPKKCKHKMGHLFKLCDELRSQFSSQGIEIKDHGIKSVWIPLIELQKILQKSY